MVVREQKDSKASKCQHKKRSADKFFMGGSSIFYYNYLNNSNFNNKNDKIKILKI
jgi:hypothetical protein